MNEVCSRSIIRAKTTVKKGAEDLMVSVNDTATYFREIRPSTTVTKRISPTSAMSHRKDRIGCVESGESCGGPTPVSQGPYILTAPKVAVIIIWHMARRLGSALSEDRMCLLPKSVQPEKKYHAAMQTPARAATESGWCGGDSGCDGVDGPASVAVPCEDRLSGTSCSFSRGLNIGPLTLSRGKERFCRARAIAVLLPYPSFGLSVFFLEHSSTG